MNNVLRLPINLRGRDFAIGDVHGCVHLVERALERVKFDPAIDRLFPVGDLIDRGPYSARSADFLRNSFVHCVPGNHERMLIDAYAGEEVDVESMVYNIQRNGMGWWLDVADSVRQDILDLIRPLPLVIEVDTARGRVGFVHAEVPIGMDWATFTEKIQTGDKHTCEQAVWGRTRIERRNASGVLGIDRVFVGHSITDQPAQLGNVFYLDTGAFVGVAEENALAGRLTIAGLACSTGVLAGGRDMGDAVSLVDVRDAHSDQPFGRYAKA